MAKDAQIILNSQAARKGSTTTPPESEIWIDAIQLALRDIKTHLNTQHHEETREEARAWILSDHAWIIGSTVYGPAYMQIIRNWVRDDLPKPEVARKRRVVYETVGEAY